MTLTWYVRSPEPLCLTRPGYPGVPPLLSLQAGIWEDRPPHTGPGEGLGGGSPQPPAMQVRPSILTPSPLLRPPSQVTSLGPGSPAQEVASTGPGHRAGSPMAPSPPECIPGLSSLILGAPRGPFQAENEGPRLGEARRPPRLSCPSVTLTRPSPHVSPASIPPSSNLGSQHWGVSTGTSPLCLPRSSPSRPHAQPQDGLTFGPSPWVTEAVSLPLDASFPPPGQFLWTHQIPLLKPDGVRGLRDANLFSLVKRWELRARAGWSAPAKNHHPPP